MPESFQGPLKPGLRQPLLWVLNWGYAAQTENYHSSCSANDPVQNRRWGASDQPHQSRTISPAATGRPLTLPTAPAHILIPPMLHQIQCPKGSVSIDSASMNAEIEHPSQALN